MARIKSTVDGISNASSYRSLRWKSSHRYGFWCVEVRCVWSSQTTRISRQQQLRNQHDVLHQFKMRQPYDRSHCFNFNICYSPLLRYSDEESLLSINDWQYHGYSYLPAKHEFVSIVARNYSESTSIWFVLCILINCYLVQHFLIFWLIW
jgi:hypothetical protein